MAWWIGGSDLLIEDNWIWEPSGEPVTFNNWYTNQPDNGGTTEVDEDCLGLIGNWVINVWGWRDEPCYKEYYYVCEHKL